MVILKTFLSDVQPAVHCGLWLKPVDGGFALYLIGNGNVQPLNLVDTNNTPSDADDTAETADGIKADLVGSVQDGKTANTINGAKAYAEDVKDTVTGTDADTSADLTLYGLKAYIDEKTT